MKNLIKTKNRIGEPKNHTIRDSVNKMNINIEKKAEGPNSEVKVQKKNKPT